MQKLFVKQGLSVAICITMALSLSAYTAACTISEQSITIVSEISARTAERFENAAAQQFNIVRGVAGGFFKAALGDLTLLKAEVSQAIIPEP